MILMQGVVNKSLLPGCLRSVVVRSHVVFPTNWWFCSYANPGMGCAADDGRFAVHAAKCAHVNQRVLGETIARSGRVIRTGSRPRVPPICNKVLDRAYKTQ